MAAIEILDLEKTYHVGFWRKRPKLALHPLRLTIEEGEVFGFLGPNGLRNQVQAEHLVRETVVLQAPGGVGFACGVAAVGVRGFLVLQE